MVWTSKLKDLATTDIVGHVNSDPALIERAPANPSVSFTPLELYGAAARCGYLSFVNPRIATAESDTIAKLVEPHVDDISNDFAILASADTFKDYVKSYFTGAVATGLAYLAMINESYVWSDHFESAGGGKTSHARKPDFVFAGHSVGVALMESKGSRSGTLAGFDKTVLDGYIGQIEPHLGYTVGGAIATHGYCIGAWLKSTTSAELRIHHTKVPAPSGGAGGAATPPLATIQRHNFATAFSLAHSPQLGVDLRRGESSYALIGFFRMQWLGRRWLTNIGPIDPLWWHSSAWRYLLWDGWDEGGLLFAPGPHIFVIEGTIATAALRNFLGRGGAPAGEAAEIAPLGEAIRDAARDYRGAEGGGSAVFPDGLAVIDQSRLKLRFEPVVWDVEAARLLP